MTTKILKMTIIAIDFRNRNGNGGAKIFQKISNEPLESGNRFTFKIQLKCNEKYKMFEILNNSAGAEQHF